MLLQIFKLIKKMEKLIGNECLVRFFIECDELSIRVEWVDANFRAQRNFSVHELMIMDDEMLALDHFVNYCKNAYKLNCNEVKDNAAGK